MKKNLTELVFILDRSGSMSGLESDTIGGYNAMLEKQQKVEGECFITTVLFDNNYVLLHDRIDIKAINPITDREYFIGGSTALLDAIGSTISKISSAQMHTNEDYRAEKIMFVIITDGEENASHEYSLDIIKSKIEEKKNKDGWEFVFLGANIDAVKTASSFGINKECAVDYLADSEGTTLNYSVMSEAIASFREEGVFDTDSLEKIRKDVKTRKKQK